MQYNVYVQDKFYGIVEADNTGSVLNKISQQISSGEISVDHNQPHNIRVEPINE